MLRDTSSPGKDTAYTVVTRGRHLGKAVRTERWRYARWPDGEELYDLSVDADECVNLATFADHTETITTMRRFLARAEATATLDERRQPSRR